MIKTYTTKLPDKQWLMLGLISDLGWIAYFAGFALYMISGAEGLETVILSALFLLGGLCVLTVLVGIIELISQRVRQLDRRLKRIQLVTGFGFVIYGSLAGFLLSTAAVFTDIIGGYETGMCFTAQIIMAAGALICFAFGLPIMRSFKPDEP